MRVRPSVDADVASWLDLAAEVAPLFGSMPDIEDHLRRNIARGTAFVVARDGTVLGAMLLSRDDVPHRINWLAVRISARRQGITSALLDLALSRWPDGGPRDVFVLRR